MFTKRNNFQVTSCLHFWRKKTFQKGVFSKRKEFASREANSLFLEMTPTDKEDKKEMSELLSPNFKKCGPKEAYNVFY